jgi:hypothetical protein
MAQRNGTGMSLRRGVRKARGQEPLPAAAVDPFTAKSTTALDGTAMSRWWTLCEHAVFKKEPSPCCVRGSAFICARSSLAVHTVCGCNGDDDGRPVAVMAGKRSRRKRMQHFSCFRPCLDAKKLPALHHKADPFVEQVDVGQGQPTLDVEPHTAHEARTIPLEPFQDVGH